MLEEDEEDGPHSSKEKICPPTYTHQKGEKNNDTFFVENLTDGIFPWEKGIQLFDRLFFSYQLFSTAMHASVVTKLGLMRYSALSGCPTGCAV